MPPITMTLLHPLRQWLRALPLCVLLIPLAASHAQSGQAAAGSGNAAPAAPKLAQSCRAIAASTQQARDGEYDLDVRGQSVRLYCHDMAGTPREYISLPAGNCSEYASQSQGLQGSRQRVQTCFDKVRLDPQTLRVDIGDLRFAHTDTEGHITHDKRPVLAMPYATAMACDGPDLPVGRAQIALTGTDFAVVGDFRPQGFRAQGDVSRSANGQQLELWGGGYCGWMAPGAVYNPHFAAGWSPFANGDGFLLQLRLAGQGPQAPRTRYTQGDPGLRLYQSYDSAKDSRAEWRGSVTVTGKLLVLFNGDRSKRSQDDQAFLIFEPDRLSREQKLPAALDRFPCQALWIWLNADADETLVSLLGEAGKNRINRGTGNRFEIDVTLKTNALQSDIYTFLGGNGRTYLIDQAVITARNTRVTAKTTRTQAPAQELPVCREHKRGADAATLSGAEHLAATNAINRFSVAVSSRPLAAKLPA